MLRASVRERPSQSFRPIPERAPKTVLRVIDGGYDGLPIWQELLGMLIFLLLHRKKKLEMVPMPEKAEEPTFYDDVPNTGVREIPAYRSDGVVTDDRLDEILRDAEPVPRVRFQVSGEKPKPSARKKPVPEAEEDPFPSKVSAHALGQFARAYLKGRGRLGQFIDQRIKERLGERVVDALDYDERLKLRKLERQSMQRELLTVSRKDGRILRDNQERLESGVEVLHIAHGPYKSYFLRFDPKTGVVLSFHSSQGFNRHKAYRRSRKKAYREGRRRFS